VNPQEFLANRINDLKGLLSGNASVEDTATFIAPGGLVGRGGLRTGLHMLRSTGKEGAAKMGLLGGDAPVRNTDYDAFLTTPVNEIFPGGVSGAIGKF
jgi:hypothetical protein